MKNLTDRKERIFLLALFVTAFALRLGFTVMAKQHYFFYHNPSADVTYYLDWAREIATTDFIGSKTFFGLPLFPYVLAVLYRLALGNIEVIRLFFLILGSLNCILLYAIAKKMFDRRVAVLSALFMATHFLMIYYDWLIMPVTLIITLSLIITFSLIEHRLLVRPRHWVILGLLIGITILGDGKFLFFLIAVVLWLWRKHPRQFKNLLLMALSALMILGFCAIRNRIVGGDWVMISAQSGLSLYSGNNPEATGTYVSPEFIRPTHTAQDADQKIVAEGIVNRSMSAGEISRFWKNKAMDFIRNQPGDFLRLLGKKFTLFFRETEYGHDLDLVFMRDWKRRWDYNALIILFPLAIIGIAVSIKQWKDRPFAVMLILCQLAVTLIFFLSTRHRATILPFLILFESVAVFWIIDRIRMRRVTSLIIAAIFFIAFVLMFRPITMGNKIIAFNRYAKAGSVYEQRGDLKQAKENYLRALNIQPFDTITLYNLGNICVQEGDLDKARALYEKVLELCAFHVDAMFNLAYIYEQTGETEKAVNFYKRIMRYQPDMPDTYFRIANIYAGQGDCQKAVPFYHKVMELQPDLKGFMQQSIDQCGLQK